MKTLRPALLWTALGLLILSGLTLAIFHSTYALVQLGVGLLVLSAAAFGTWVTLTALTRGKPMIGRIVG